MMNRLAVVISRKVPGPLPSLLGRSDEREFSR